MLALVAAYTALGGCASAPPPRAQSPLEALRSAGASSSDEETVGRWMFTELVAPDGDAAALGRARKRLEGLPSRGGYGALAMGLDDDAHGRIRSASDAYLNALSAASASRDAEGAELVAWFAANRLLKLRESVPGLWDRARSTIERMIEQPGRIGWRARGELVEWWAIDGARDRLAKRAEARPAEPWGRELAARYGCVAHARLAGPFGRGAPADSRRHFDAERAGPWPVEFASSAGRLTPPHVMETEISGCQIRPSEVVDAGVFYVESFFDLPAEGDVLVAVQGALAVFVDDAEVLSRDTSEWGIWPRFGAQIRLRQGNHRVLARLASAETSIRLLGPSGVPLAVETSADAAKPYAILPPEREVDPNPLEPWLRALGVSPQKDTPTRGNFRDDVPNRYLASYLAHVEGQDDVASVLLEPLVKEPDHATAIALSAQALYLDKDPIFPASDARDLASDLRRKASQKDANLWWPRLWLVLEEADRVGLAEIVPRLEALAERFHEVPEVVKALSSTYARAGWKAEHARAVKEAAERFPEDLDASVALLRLYDDQGRAAEADALVERIRAVHPDSEVSFDRALERRDYAAAIAEAERLGGLRQDRKAVALRVADLLTRSGKRSDSVAKLERAVEKHPTDAQARLDLADARFAQGDKSALARALVEAIEKGADTAQLREAIELVDGTNELEPYRIDGRSVISEFEASGEALSGSGARVLDYSAIWIHRDGSARMLEHEIICVKSREAIAELAEQKVPNGLVLRQRTLKRDGTIFEPEMVEGKPTVTMPHLEVGDYIETENVTTLRGDGRGGVRFEGPRWFFREEKLAYWRSEFIVVSPKSRPLDIETGGKVAPPSVTEDAATVTRRWRVDKAPAVPEEPASAPIQEFLPNVRIGWGIHLDETIERLVEAGSSIETPSDPRLARVARAIALAASGESAPATDVDQARALSRIGADEKARRLYRWVLANVEEGREQDGRRVVIGKSGERLAAFRYLAHLIGLDVKLGVIRDRLTEPTHGTFSEAEQFNAVALRIATEHGPRWMTVRDKFAPYGYLPNSLRGQPAVVLAPGAPRETTPLDGARDAIANEGTVTLSEDGSAKLVLDQRYEGKFAIGLRTALEALPDARLNQAIESRLLPQSLPGARLTSLSVKNAADLDAPLVLSMTIEMPNFARRRGDELVISPPFKIDLGALASLPTRETPLFLSEQVATRSSVKLAIDLPRGARVATRLSPMRAEDGRRAIEVADRAEDGRLVLERVVELPAGRVQPSDYPAFEAFVRAGLSALYRDVTISLRSASAGELVTRSEQAAR